MLFGLRTEFGYAIGPTVSFCTGQDWEDSKRSMDLLLEAATPGLSVSVDTTVGAGLTVGLLAEVWLARMLSVRGGVMHAEYFAPMTVTNRDNSADWVRTGVRYRFLEAPVTMKLRILHHDGRLLTLPWFGEEGVTPQWSVSILVGGAVAYGYDNPVYKTRYNGGGDKTDLDNSNYTSVLYRATGGLEFGRSVRENRSAFLNIAYSVNVTPITEFTIPARDDTRLHSVLITLGWMWSGL
jgi:hypothetical protein